MDMLKAFYIGLVFLLCGVMGEVCAQDLAKVDSLKKELGARKGKDRMDVLWELAKIHWDDDTTEASKYIEESYRLARIAPVDSFLFVKTGKGKAMLLRLFEKYGEAFAVLDEVLPVARRHGFDEEAGACLNVEGVMYSMRGKYDKALSSQLECLRIRESLRDTLDLSVAQNNIGLTYYKIGNYKKALDYYTRCQESKRAIRNQRDLDLVNVNIGLCHLYLGEIDSGLYNVKKGLSLCAEHCSPNVLLNGNLALGMFYMKLNRSDSAKIFLMRCYKSAVRENSSRYKSESLLVLARHANDEGCWGEALKYSLESEKNAIQVNSVNMANQTYYELFRAKRGLKDYNGAAVYWDKYLLYHDSLFNESLEYALIGMHIDFEQTQNESRLALQESTVQWQGRQNFWIALIGGLLIIAIELLIYDYTGRKRENQILEALVHDRTHTLQEKVRSLEREETERKAWEQKIGRAVHEGATRLDALTAITGKQQLTDAVRILRALDT